MSDPRYPIGPFERRDTLEPGERQSMIEIIANAPARMREAVAGLDDAQLDTPYREGGWKVRQVVHHIADSHMNAFIRHKLALTKDHPTISPYDENEWAKLADAEMPIETSLTLLETLHARWITIFRAMRGEDFRRTFKHPDHDGVQSLDWLVAMYAWHSRHHVAHVTSLRERKGW